LVLAGAMGNLYDRTMVNAYVWSDPVSRTRDIGTLLAENEVGVRIGDYPTGENPRTHLLRPTHYAGPTPVVGVAMLVLSFWREQHAPAPAPARTNGGMAP
jgi:hypothetical protein